MNYKQYHYYFKDTHCFCTEKWEQGKLNKTCGLNISSHFQSDIIGTSILETYFYQIAMYKISFNIEGTNLILDLVILFIFDLKDVNSFEVISVKSRIFTVTENSLDECVMMNTTDDVRNYPCDTAGTS